MSNHRPEDKFQAHIAEYLRLQHGYTIIETFDIKDKEYYLATDLLLAFIKATQAETLKQLTAEYGSESVPKIIAALKNELVKNPLWLIMRSGLWVESYHFQLFYPKPRSSQGVANLHWQQNRFSFKTEFLIEKNKRPDIVLFLNGLPVIVLELKHQAGGQNVHDAVTQFNHRNHDDKIFQLPFLYVAMDTADVKVATNPSKANHFLLHNAGLINEQQTEGEYPVEFFYRDVLAPENILRIISFYLVYVPENEKKAAYTLFPRYHQARLVNHLSADIAAYFSEKNEVGKKYLVNHSAGSGKTLTISWLAERLHSLFKGNTKLFNIIFILLDRKDLDKNIRDELDNFKQLSEQMTYADSAEDLRTAIKKEQSIIVTTIQKFQYLFSVLNSDKSLKKLRIAFLIDEAHRSQEGKNARAIRSPFSNEIIEEAEDSIEEIQKVLTAYQPNQLFVAFTATPTERTTQLFGEPFDVYSEAEAIAEGYIIDVAAQIISYETLYNLESPLIPNKEEEKLYPKGIVTQLLTRIAFEDEGLIQYKAEIILRTFEEQIKPLINDKAKAMVVTSSRIAGLRYFNILQAKIAEKHKSNPEKYNYKVLYAFSDFTDIRNNQQLTEHGINGLERKEKIEERFKQDDYRIMIVASKFQTGFDEPLLAGMFLDKPVKDKNAVQTLSRLNRCYEDKKTVIVVDFTNNTADIIKAFNKYRKGSPYESSEPDKEKVNRIYQDIIDRGLFTNKDAEAFLILLKNDNDADMQNEVNRYRARLVFFYPTIAEQKD
jgi:type I restriction enzyme R subunit